MPLSDTTVAIPTIPPRSDLLSRAVESVIAQTRPASAVSIAVDLDREGAAVTRQRALDAVATPWVAFLDDDSEMMPEHLAVLHEAQANTDGDYVFPWYEAVPSEHGPFAPYFDRLTFDPADPHPITIMCLVRTDLAKAIRFRVPDPSQIASGEDRRFVLDVAASGAKIVYVPRRTWRWDRTAHHSTSGMAHRWDPAMRVHKNVW